MGSKFVVLDIKEERWMDCVKVSIFMVLKNIFEKNNFFKIVKIYV